MYTDTEGARYWLKNRVRVQIRPGLHLKSEDLDPGLGSRICWFAGLHCSIIMRAYTHALLNFCIDLVFRFLQNIRENFLNISRKRQQNFSQLQAKSPLKKLPCGYDIFRIILLIRSANFSCETMTINRNWRVSSFQNFLNFFRIPALPNQTYKWKLQLKINLSSTEAQTYYFIRWILSQLRQKSGLGFFLFIENKT
jgi:hypothetical protein